MICSCLSVTAPPTHLTHFCTLIQALYLSVMDAVYPVNNKVLFFVEGCGQGDLNGANW